MDTLWLVILTGLIALACARNRRILSHRYLETNEIEDETCLDTMERVYTDHVIAPNPPNLVGEWTSSRCEVRPGPEFLLRRYKFSEGLLFELHQYYYRDSSCTDPAYSIVATGELSINEASWLVPGGLDADYTLSFVSVRPYTDHVAKKLQENFSRNCPQMVTEMWKAQMGYVLYEFKLGAPRDSDEDADILIDHDCRSALNLVFHELQLLRMEVRKRGLEIRKQLFLGDIHTDYTQREAYRPTSYQDPLSFSQNSGCSVCTRIMNSKLQYPPTLYTKDLPEHGLIGEWFSERCEVRPVGQFLTRHFMFKQDDMSWEGYFHYFSDARCLQPLFTVHAAGSYMIGQNSDDIDGAFEFDVKVSRMQVTPRDTRIVNLMNEDMGGDVCGSRGSWIRGKSQDVTQTGGCAMLGLKVPVLAYELLRLEKEHHKTLLYLGQGQTVGTDKSEQAVRSTSFQAPLVRCGAVGSTRNAFDNSLPQGEGHISVNIQAQVAPASSLRSSASQIKLSVVLAFIGMCVVILTSNSL